MHPPSSKPMEVAAVACRAGLLSRARRPGSRAPRTRAWEHGVAAVGPARRRLLVASLGVGELLPAQSLLREDQAVTLEAGVGVGEPLPAQSLGEDAVALEILVQVDDDMDSLVSAENLLPPAAADGMSSTPSRRADKRFMSEVWFIRTTKDDKLTLARLVNLTVPVPEASTVRVKFVLRKQCAFGQQFVVVGGDTALGLWDPAKAIALDWSEGHVWTAKTDLPANRSIEFKFLLRDASGHVCWQHGANRTLQITGTTNTMVVHEDWDHGNKQKVLVEELSIGEDVIFSEDLAVTNGAMPAEDDPQKHQNLETDRSAAVVADAPLQGGIVAANGTDQPESQLTVDKHQTILEEVPGEQNGTHSDDDYAINNDDDTTLYQGGDLLPNRPSIFENDLAWAGKAMQQLLRIFQIGTST